MRAETREWVDYAEEDYAMAAMAVRTRRKLAAHSVGFHCQQCVEKYLKARLIEAGITTPKTHDLQVLLNLVLAVQPLWASFGQSVGLLTAHAVRFRYPGHFTTRADARSALKTCRVIRAEVRLSLNLPKK